MEAHRQQRDVRTFQPKSRYIIRSPLIHVCNNFSILNFAVLFISEKDIQINVNVGGVYCHEWIQPRGGETVQSAARWLSMQNKPLTAANQPGVVRGGKAATLVETLSAVCLEFCPWNLLFLITSCITCYI